MNQTWLQGRLANDPEAGVSTSGVNYTKFAVAIERNGKEGKETMFLDCVGFKQTADFVAKYFSKGDGINITGAITVRDWVDQSSGVKHRKYEIIANQVGFPVNGKRQGQGKSNGNGRSNAAPVAAGATTAPSDYEDY